MKGLKIENVDISFIYEKNKWIAPQKIENLMNNDSNSCLGHKHIVSCPRIFGEESFLPQKLTAKVSYTNARSKI